MNDDDPEAESGAWVLDDPQAIATADAGGMLQSIASLGDQLERGYEAARGAADLPSGEGVRNVVVCGMGGSGIAGDVVRTLYADRARVPIVVCKGYALPEFVDHNTLVVAVSFSGNTEETVTAFGYAVEIGARTVAVSAGGELEARAKEEGVPHVAVPGDVGMPRAALGYLCAAPIGVLDAAGLVPDARAGVAEAAEALRVEDERLGPDRPLAENEAKAIAAWIGDRTPIVWGPEGLGEAVALRWKNQFNENAKVPAFAATLPELDHNDVEGWGEGGGIGYAVLVLRPGHAARWVDRRVAATLRVLEGSGLAYREVRGREGSAIARVFTLASLGDHASVYLAVLRGVDPTPVPVLTRLKEELRR